MLGLILLLLIGVVTLALAAMLLGGFVCLFQQNGLRLKLAFCALLVLGGATAIWATFFFEYQPSPNYRILGAPFPAAVFHLENGRWVDFVGGPGILIDLVVITASVTAPASIPLFLRTFRRYRSKYRLLHGHCPACNYDLRGSQDRCPECGTSVAIA